MSIVRTFGTDGWCSTNAALAEFLAFLDRRTVKPSNLIKQNPCCIVTPNSAIFGCVKGTYMFQASGPIDKHAINLVFGESIPLGRQLMFGIFKKKPSYNRDYIIGSICSMVESQMGGSDLDSFLSGKLVISNEVRSLGWIGGSSVPRDGYSLLLDLNKISSDEKMLLDIMLQGVSEAHGMAKTVATDMVATALHKCLKQGSEQYAKLDFEDPRLR